MGSLKKLQIFDASENKIEFLPDEISGCVALTDFHLSQNLLEDLPDTIGMCRIPTDSLMITLLYIFSNSKNIAFPFLINFL